MIFDPDKIQPHHVEWIFNAALKEFASDLENIERELIRHERFKDSPSFHRFGQENRKDKLADLERRRQEMSTLCAYVNELRTAAQTRNAEMDAKELVASLQLRPASPPKKKRTAKRA